MNGLKKLFSKRALAATATSGLLLVSVVTAYAAYSVDTSGQPLNCGTGYLCHDENPLGNFYWCCGSAKSCAPPVTTGCPNGFLGYCGWCN